MYFNSDFDIIFSCSSSCCHCQSLMHGKHQHVLYERMCRLHSFLSYHHRSSRFLIQFMCKYDLFRIAALSSSLRTHKKSTHSLLHRFNHSNIADNCFIFKPLQHLTRTSELLLMRTFQPLFKFCAMLNENLSHNFYDCTRE